MVANRQPAHRRTNISGTRAIPSSGAVLGSRRPGLLLAGRGSGVNKRASTVARRHEEEYSMIDTSAVHEYSAYGDLDEQEDVVPPKPVKTPGHWQPGKRGRPPASHSQKRSFLAFNLMESVTLKLVHSIFWPLSFFTLQGSCSARGEGDCGFTAERENSSSSCSSARHSAHVHP